MCMYASVCHQYLHLLHALDHWGTDTTTASPKHPLVTQHPGGPTQGTPGHVPDHFLTPSQPPTRPDFSIFPSRIGVWTYLAKAIESARMLWTGQNFTQ